MPLVRTKAKGIYYACDRDKKVSNFPHLQRILFCGKTLAHNLERTSKFARLFATPRASVRTKEVAGGASDFK